MLKLKINFKNKKLNKFFIYFFAHVIFNEGDNLPAIWKLKNKNQSLITNAKQEPTRWTSSKARSFIG